MSFSYPCILEFLLIRLEYCTISGTLLYGMMYPSTGIMFYILHFCKYFKIITQQDYTSLAHLAESIVTEFVSLDWQID